MATVDVLVPTYNRSGMLRQCLESIQAETYTDIRVIIGDNCSDDDTRAVAQDFCDRDSRFSYVRNAMNLGMYGNMNALFTRVTAPYVHFMHDDDWIEPDFYAKLLPVIDASPSVGIVFSRSEVAQAGSEYPPMLPVDVPDEKSLLMGEVFQWVLRWQAVMPSATLIRTSALYEIGPFAEEFVSSDWLMWLEMSLGHDIAMVDAPLAHYRVHSAQASTNTFFMYKDILKMLTFACDLPVFEGHTTELSEARFSMFRSGVLTLKEAARPRNDILALASLFRQLDGDHCSEARGVVSLALAYAALPSWFKHGVMGKGSRFRRVTKRLFGFGTSRGVDA